jgi:hypothetical protein
MKRNFLCSLNVREQRQVQTIRIEHQGRSSMKASYQIASAVFLVLAISTMASAAWANDPIVGTWHLVSWSEEETETKAVRKMFGDKPDGLLTFTSDHRMMQIVTDPTRKLPAQPKITDAEALQLFQTMNAVAGTHKTEGNKLTFRREIDARGAFVGAEQVRFFEVNGDRLQYKSVPFISSFDGKQIVSMLVWERVK